jgi:hypothetical protein
MGLIILALTPAAEIDKLNDSAKKAARRALKALQTMGYFDGVQVVAVERVMGWKPEGRRRSFSGSVHDSPPARFRAGTPLTSIVKNSPER